MNRDFRSDNVAPPSPAILENMLMRSRTWQEPYGTDAIGALLTEQIQTLFEHDADVFPILTGTAANALVLGHCARAFGTVLCHAQSHIFLDECGAVEFQGRGLRLSPIGGTEGKLDLDDVRSALNAAEDVHQLRAGALSVSQATEAGTVYTSRELTGLSTLARQAGIPVHMDGTRFANALAFTGSSPAHLTWKCGVDALCLGATKGGVPGAEAIIFFNRELAKDFCRVLKRNGHLPSRLWLISAQLEAYLTDDFWLKGARRANLMAKRLAAALSGIRLVKPAHPVETNMVFLHAEQELWELLRTRGFRFYTTEVEGVSSARFVMSYATETDDVDRLAESLLAAAREFGG
jgi:threonine aldolase